MLNDVGKGLLGQSSFPTLSNTVGEKVLDPFENPVGWCWMLFYWFDLFFQNLPIMLRIICRIRSNTLLDSV